jgi:hypothetical protein
MDEKEKCEQLLETCNKIKPVVSKLVTRDTYKQRPLPLNTVEALKLIAR